LRWVRVVDNKIKYIEIRDPTDFRSFDH